MKTIISTSNAPQAIGPYSQAVAEGNLVFCSGQLGMVPATGQLVSYAVAEQTKQALENLRAVLAAAGSDFSKVLKTTLYLKSIDDFTMVNEVYATYFPSDPPARATVEVARLPKNALVEIDCIAHL